MGTNARMALWALAGASLCLAPACDATTSPDDGPGVLVGKGDSPYGEQSVVEPLNPATGDLVLYEIQARSANACHPSTGGPACATRIAPSFAYHGTGCAELADLQAIRKGTLDDLVRTDPSPHRAAGITLQYVDEVVGANAVWLMPLYPHNYEFNLPHHCDDIGSPYAVRDFMHVRGSLSEACVAAGRDEWSADKCWGDAALGAVIADAHDRGMRVVLDLAFNHLGHEYHFYDTAGVVPTRTRLARGDRMWDFDATREDALVWPAVADALDAVPADALAAVDALCEGGAPSDDERVRRALMWREAFDHERAGMSCGRSASLEQQVPGFYLGADRRSPSTGVGDNFTNNWVDVKFLYNEEHDPLHFWEFARTREYAFRVVNHWLSRGVDGFRLDHANGLTEEEWRYIFRKAEYYQALRGMPAPIFLAESFHDIGQLNRVFDALTEGWQHDATHGRRHAQDLEEALFTRREWLGGLSYVLLNLESHDEGRLIGDETGLDAWRGVAFHALAAASRGILMVQMGQEWGDPVDVGFRRSDYLRGRFAGEPSWRDDGDAIAAAYRAIHLARLAPENRALRDGRYTFLRTDRGEVKEQLLALVKHTDDCASTVFGFFRLWVDDVAATFAVPDSLASAICLSDAASYRLVDATTGADVWREAYPDGRTGAHIREFGVYARLGPDTPYQYLRLELAAP